MLLAALLLTLWGAPTGEVRAGAQAPAFTLTDAQGVPRSLADYRGNYVILEWVNFGCPFVGKHYGSGSMQALQRLMTGKGVAWLSLCSSAPGKQGYYEGDALRMKLNEEGASPSAYLQDPDGTVGKLYGAKTTPYMVIIDQEGTVVYEGAIDSIPSTEREDIARATNYVKEVMQAVWDGKPAPVKTTRSYGCSVKYR